MSKIGKAYDDFDAVGTEAEDVYGKSVSKFEVASSHDFAAKSTALFNPKRVYLEKHLKKHQEQVVEEAKQAEKAQTPRASMPPLIEPIPEPQPIVTETLPPISSQIASTVQDIGCNTCGGGSAKKAKPVYAGIGASSGAVIEQFDERLAKGLVLPFIDPLNPESYFPVEILVKFKASYDKFMTTRGSEDPRFFVFDDNDLRKQFVLIYMKEKLEMPVKPGNPQFEEMYNYLYAGTRVIAREGEVVSTRNTMPCVVEVSCPLVVTNQALEGNIIVTRSREHTTTTARKFNTTIAAEWGPDYEARLKGMSTIGAEAIVASEKSKGHHKRNIDKTRVKLSHGHAVMRGLRTIGAKLTDVDITEGKTIEGNMYAMDVPQYNAYKKEVLGELGKLPMDETLVFGLQRQGGESWSNLESLEDMGNDERSTSYFMTKDRYVELIYRFMLRFIAPPKI